MFNILSLVSDLETGITHTEVHGVHVDLSSEGLLLSSLHVGVDVFVEWR